MKALHTVLICLIIFAVFNYTAATLGPSIQQDDNLVLKEKTALYSSVEVSLGDIPGLITLGDPIEDPLPHEH